MAQFSRFCIPFTQSFVASSVVCAPRRAWYQSAMNSTYGGWTQPYTSFSTGATMVTYSSPAYAWVEPGAGLPAVQERAGVVGVDLNVDYLSGYLQAFFREVANDPTGLYTHMFIVDHDNRVVSLYCCASDLVNFVFHIAVKRARNASPVVIPCRQKHGGWPRSRRNREDVA